MRESTYIAPKTEIVIAMSEHSLLTDSLKKYIQPIEEAEEVTDVELGGNTNNLWDEDI